MFLFFTYFFERSQKVQLTKQILLYTVVLKNNVHVVANNYLQNLNLILNRNDLEKILKQHVHTWAGKLHVLYWKHCWSFITMHIWVRNYPFLSCILMKKELLPNLLHFHMYMYMLVKLVLMLSLIGGFCFLVLDGFYVGLWGKDLSYKRPVVVDGHLIWKQHL